LDANVSIGPGDRDSALLSAVRSLQEILDAHYRSKDESTRRRVRFTVPFSASFSRTGRMPDPDRATVAKKMISGAAPIRSNEAGALSGSVLVLGHYPLSTRIDSQTRNILR
jgi:hypothetical protein